MPTTYTFDVYKVDCYDGELNGLTGVIQQVHWTITGNDGTNTASVAAATTVPYDPNTTFTDIETLDKDTVIGWVRAALAANEVPEDIQAAAADGDEKAMRRVERAGHTEAYYTAQIDELLARQSAPPVQPSWIGT